MTAMWSNTAAALIIAILACACAMGSKVRKRRIRSSQVYGPPYWSNDMMYQSHVIVPEGNAISLTCPAEGNPPPTIRWLKESNFVDAVFPQAPDPSRMELVSYPENWTLILNNAHRGLSGNYTCIVGNQYGKLQFTYFVEIIPRDPHPPIIRKKPESQTVVEGSSVTLECRVVSDLPLQIKWLWHYRVNNSFIDKRGKPYTTTVKQRNVTEYGDTWGQTLYLRRVRTAETGWYTCVVANPFGSSHASAWLEVITEVEANSRAQTSSAAVTVSPCSWTVCGSSIRNPRPLFSLFIIMCIHWTLRKFIQSS